MRTGRANKSRKWMAQEAGGKLRGIPGGLEGLFARHQRTFSLGRVLLCHISASASRLHAGPYRRRTSALWSAAGPLHVKSTKRVASLGQSTFIAQGFSELDLICAACMDFPPRGRPWLERNVPSVPDGPILLYEHV